MNKMKFNATYSTEEMADFFYGGLFTNDFLFSFKCIQVIREDHHRLEYVLEKFSGEKEKQRRDFVEGKVIDLRTWPCEIELSEQEYNHLKGLLEGKEEVTYNTREDWTKEGLKRPVFPAEYQIFEEIEKRMQKAVGRRSY